MTDEPPRMTFTEERLEFSKYPMLHELGTLFDKKYDNADTIVRVGDTFSVHVWAGTMVYAEKELKKYAKENPGIAENNFFWRGVMIEVKQA